jgi:membrane-bound lytic murein transglycosylase F
LSSGELRVVTRNSPTTFYHGVDEPRGVEYELVKGFADRLGVALKIEVAEQFRQIFPEVQSGRAHIGAAGLTVSPALRAMVDFSPAYQRVQHQVIYRRGTQRPYAVEDLHGGRLEVLAGSAYVGALKRARHNYPLLSWTENPDDNVEELVRRVAAGKIDYTLVDSNAFELLQHSHPDARVGFTLAPEIPLAWALPKTNDTSLRESVSAYFAELQASGELTALLDRYYFDEPENFDYVGTRAFIRHFDSRFPEYKRYFLEASARTGVDWRLLAAMAYQESHWNNEAVSPTGVKGMMMLTRHTASSVGVEDRTDPRQSILGGADYFAHLSRRIPARIAEPDRIWLAVAAYNIGFGHLEDARIITEIEGANPDSWVAVRDRLPYLTDREWFERVSRGYARGHEAVVYVDNIRRYYEILSWLTAEEMFTEEHRRPAQNTHAG